MSLSALTLAARNRLRTELSLENNACEVTLDGQPIPLAADVFYAVHHDQWQNTGQNVGELEEDFGLVLTISMRGGNIAFDRWGPELLAKATTGLWDRARAAIVKIHGDYTLMNAANTIIGSAATYNRFVEPVWLSNVTTQYKPPSWWHRETPSTKGMKYEGAAAIIRFSSAKRIQTLESMA